MTDTRPDASIHPAKNGVENGRLDSWKEIAAYLGRGVTTVQLAFLVNEEGADQDTRGLYLVSPSGGSPRRLMSIYGTGLCWTPDGSSLAFTDRTSTGEPFSIFSTSLESGRRERLTTPPAGAFGDTRCAFSPDGRRLAVSRFASRYQSDVYVIALHDGNTDGERLTQGLSGIQGVDWTPDGAGMSSARTTACGWSRRLRRLARSRPLSRRPASP